MLLARSGVLLLLALALRTRRSAVYFTAVALLVLDLSGTAYRYAADLSGVVAAVLDSVLALAALLALFSAFRDFGRVSRRLLTELDRDLRGGEDYHRHGVAYRREGKWALAVLHWRQAAALLPAEPQVHKDLAIAYSQLGRFDRAVAALTRAEQLLPDDLEIEEMLTLVRARRAIMDGAPGRDHRRE